MGAAYKGTTAEGRDPEEIFAAISNFDTAQEYIEFYVEEAERVKAKEISSVITTNRVNYLKAFAAISVIFRVIQISCSGSRAVGQLATAAAAFSPIPGTRLAVMKLAVGTFNKQAIARVGLGDSEKTQELLGEAQLNGLVGKFIFKESMGIIEEHAKEEAKEKFKELWRNSDLEDMIQQEAGNHMHDELSAVLAEELSTYVLPGLFHGRNAIKGWNVSSEKMDKALSVLAVTALDFHTEVLMPIVLQRIVMVDGISNGIKKIGEKLEESCNQQ